MVDRAMMTLIALVNRAMKKKTGRKLREKKWRRTRKGRCERLRVDRQMGNEIIRLLSFSPCVSLSLLPTEKCIR
jgi:hypothetical protein